MLDVVDMFDVLGRVVDGFRRRNLIYCCYSSIHRAIFIFFIFESRPRPTSTRPHSKQMPKEIKEIKEFLLLTRRADVRGPLRITSSGGVEKFKLRCSKYLYTLVLDDKTKGEKLKASLPPALLPKAKVSKKTAKK